MGSLTSPPLDLMEFICLLRRPPLGCTLGLLRLWSRCAWQQSLPPYWSSGNIASQSSKHDLLACLNEINILRACRGVRNTSRHPGLSPHFYFSEASYRYSVLRGMEDQGSAKAAEEDVDRGCGAVEMESDEVSALQLPDCCLQRWHRSASFNSAFVSRWRQSLLECTTGPEAHVGQEASK